MEEDKLMTLANVAIWLSEKENHSRQVHHILGSENKPSKKPMLASNSSLSAGKDNNGTELWPRGVRKKKRTSTVRKGGSRPVNTAQNLSIDSLHDRIRAAGGEELELAVEKRLTATDLSSDHGRLSMPKGSLRSRFLRGEDEAARVRRPNGLWVAVVDEGGREYNLRLRQWSMGNGPIFNLNGDWNSVAARNSLSHKDLVQLWSFRRGSQLCFAFVKPSDLTN